MYIFDQAVHTTFRIATSGPDGNGSGTGFALAVAPKGKQSIPLLVTCKHVIEGTTSLTVYFTTKQRNVDAPHLGSRIEVPIRMEAKSWVHHPDPTVDLVATSLTDILDHVRDSGHEPFYRSVAYDMLTTSDEFDDLLAIERVTMIGYPNGLWDKRHNLPITRQGITATPLFANFENRPEFMIDMACFPGSSGSPVFLLDRGYVDGKGRFHRDKIRTKLVGVLYAGPLIDAEGEIIVRKAPQARTPFVVSQVMMHLGYCVKANQLFWFDDYYRERSGMPKNSKERVKIWSEIRKILEPFEPSL